MNPDKNLSSSAVCGLRSAVVLLFRHHNRRPVAVAIRVVVRQCIHVSTEGKGVDCEGHTGRFAAQVGFGYRAGTIGSGCAGGAALSTGAPCASHQHTRDRVVIGVVHRDGYACRPLRAARSAGVRSRSPTCIGTGGGVAVGSGVAVGAGVAVGGGSLQALHTVTTKPVAVAELTVTVILLVASLKTSPTTHCAPESPVLPFRSISTTLAGRLREGST